MTTIVKIHCQNICSKEGFVYEMFVQCHVLRCQNPCWSLLWELLLFYIWGGRRVGIREKPCIRYAIFEAIETCLFRTRVGWGKWFTFVLFRRIFLKDLPERTKKNQETLAIWQWQLFIAQWIQSICMTATTVRCHWHDTRAQIDPSQNTWE